ncbi:hypothetical protein, partial [Colidextribacter sp. OB.20]|uniref:hypothetical protein n=1 Tax=Colidextribacter sp. OB.20 TaxID=2304568 RepID=UPI001A9B62D9
IARVVARIAAVSAAVLRFFMSVIRSLLFSEFMWLLQPTQYRKTGPKSRGNCNLKAEKDRGKN